MATQYVCDRCGVRDPSPLKVARVQTAVAVRHTESNRGVDTLLDRDLCPRCRGALNELLIKFISNER